MMYLKLRYRLGYETLIKEVSDSLLWRRFCHLGLFEPAPDSTTLVKLGNKYGSGIIDELNELFIERCSQEKIIRSKKVRADTTVIEANIHPPTDAGLLGDCVKVITRKVGKIKGLGFAQKIKWRNRLRSTKRRLFSLIKTVGRKRTCTQEEVRSQVKAILSQTKRVAKEGTLFLNSVRQSIAGFGKKKLQQALRIERQARNLMASLAENLKITQKIIEQTEQVLSGASRIPDRLVSIFDTQARPIKRGRIGRDVEFGYKVYLQQTGEQIISHYQTYEGNPADGVEMLEEGIAHHIREVGRAPELVAADTSFSSPETETNLYELGVKRLAIPSRSRKKRREQKRKRWFQRARRWRAGIEGDISLLKRGFQLARALVRGLESVRSWVGWGVLANNLWRVARISEKAEATG